MACKVEDQYGDDGFQYDHAAGMTGSREIGIVSRDLFSRDQPFEIEHVSLERRLRDVALPDNQDDTLHRALSMRTDARVSVCRIAKNSPETRGELTLRSSSSIHSRMRPIKVVSAGALDCHTGESYFLTWRNKSG